MDIQYKIEKDFLDQLRQWYHGTPDDLQQLEEAEFYDLINEYPELWNSCVDYYTCDVG